MTLNEFENSLKNPTSADPIEGLLLALWQEAKGDWHAAHNIAQEFETTDGYWVHAYLHRKEGDESNADYWYKRAGKKFPKMSLESEWADIAAYLLKQTN